MMYSSEEEFISKRNTRGYLLWKMWSPGGIHKPCVLWMFSSNSGLGSSEDTIKSSYLSDKCSLHKHRSSVLESCSTVCMELWYIWKARNNKIFSNLDIDPLDTLKLAETKSTLWAETHILNEQRTIPPTVATILPSIPRIWCSADGSWKEGDTFSGKSWYSTLEGFYGLLGAKNVRASLSPLHAEMEALVWAMVCMRNLRQSQVTFATDCFNWWRWFRKQKNCQLLQIIWKMSRPWNRVSPDQRLSMYHECKIQRRIN